MHTPKSSLLDDANLVFQTQTQNSTPSQQTPASTLIGLSVALDGYVRNLIEIFLLACQVITTHKGNKKGNIHYETFDLVTT